MGHIHLGVLPGSKKWREVVNLLADGAVDEDVLAASACAAEKDLASAANDPTFVEAVRLLAMVPVAARSEDFGNALRDLDVPVQTDPSLMDIAVAIGKRLDEVARQLGRQSDFGELSRRALLASFSNQMSDRLPGLFDVAASDVKSAARSLSGPRSFATYSRSFFTRLLSETLHYWLDRTLSAHVGPGQRFRDARSRSAFDQAITQYCSEATFIIKEFSAGWFAKTLHREGMFDSRSAAAYGAVAFKKINEELRLKRGADG